MPAAPSPLTSCFVTASYTTTSSLGTLPFSMTEQLAKRLLQRLRDLAVAVEVKAHDLEHFGNPNSFTLRSAALVGSPAETRGNVAACRWCVRHGPNRVGLPAGNPMFSLGRQPRATLCTFARPVAKLVQDGEPISPGWGFAGTNRGQSSGKSSPIQPGVARRSGRPWLIQLTSRPFRSSSSVLSDCGRIAARIDPAAVQGFMTENLPDKTTAACACGR